MCYNLTATRAAREQEQVYIDYQNSYDNPDLYERVYYMDGFSHPDLPVVTVQKPETVQYYEWGFIPGWVKDNKTASELSLMCLNANSETIFEKPAFRASVDNRCLVLIQGFYEWRHIGKEKFPYFIHLKGKDLFTLGGLTNEWTDKETGELKKTMTILTTAANPLMEMIHNTKKRMPLILDEEMADAWLKDVSTSEIKDIMKPIHDAKMEAWTISRLVSNRNANRNVPEILKPHGYPELQATQLGLF